MTNHFKRNVVVGYVVLFFLLIIFVAVSTINATKIEAATTALVNQKLPGLIAASQLKHNFQAQTIELYELYATNDQVTYRDNYAKNKSSILTNAGSLQLLAGLNSSATTIEKMSQNQDDIASKFVGIMASEPVDWDAARAQLQLFSQGTVAIDSSLDALVTSITKQTQQQAETSKQHLKQLFTIGIVFVGLLFLGLTVMLLIARKQKNVQQGHFLSR